MPVFVDVAYKHVCVRTCVCDRESSVKLNAEQRALRGTEEHIVSRSKYDSATD